VEVFAINIIFPSRVYFFLPFIFLFIHEEMVSQLYLSLCMFPRPLRSRRISDGRSLFASVCRKSLPLTFIPLRLLRIKYPGRLCKPILLT